MPTIRESIIWNLRQLGENLSVLRDIESSKRESLDKGGHLRTRLLRANSELTAATGDLLRAKYA